MKLETHDPCLLYTQNVFGLSGQAEIPCGIKYLQTDYTLTVCNKLFLDKEEKESAAFCCKSRQYLQVKSPRRFNRAKIKTFDNDYEISHDQQFDDLKTLISDSVLRLSSYCRWQVTLTLQLSIVLTSRFP